MRSIANDDDVLTLSDAEALLLEIRRLSAELVRLESQVRELEELAHTDCMLNLLNRRAFVICLESLIARVERHGGPAAMLFVDVDNLKPVNDGFGHNAGDAALARVGQLLTETARKSDCVARIGGDEFGILLERADELAGWQMALRIVERAVDFCFEGKSMPLSVAVGVAEIRAGDRAADVMRRADEAMYRIKSAGGIRATNRSKSTASKNTCLDDR